MLITGRTFCPPGPPCEESRTPMVAVIAAAAVLAAASVAVAVAVAARAVPAGGGLIGAALIG
ncbi:hypothetical protein Sros01_48310 [Streptomyces roseochromogenus]|nr:hypothetical protein Sros01_48310 [Streptomyces roseochromogenus]